MRAGSRFDQFIDQSHFHSSSAPQTSRNLKMLKDIETHRTRDVTRTRTSPRPRSPCCVGRHQVHGGQQRPQIFASAENLWSNCGPIELWSTWSTPSTRSTWLTEFDGLMWFYKVLYRSLQRGIKRCRMERVSQNVWKVSPDLARVETCNISFEGIRKQWCAVPPLMCLPSIAPRHLQRWPDLRAPAHKGFDCTQSSLSKRDKAPGNVRVVPPQLERAQPEQLWPRRNLSAPTPEPPLWFHDSLHGGRR